ncbi:MAG TPA: phosphopantetheine-binding protein, partial [Acidobacteriaceae bacterium]|nr:phosphopantetheine-binding protein [Acidobacteriaceae bacterium]
EIPGLRLTPLRSVSGGVDFDLLVSVVERAEGPRLQIEYNTDLFSSERIEGLLAAFQQTLSGALAHPELPISQISLPSSVSPTPSTARALSSTAPADLVATVAAHATKTPEAIAVRAGARQLSWRELEERSHALAAQLEQNSTLTEATQALIVLTPEVESAIALLASLELGDRAPRITPLPAHTTAEDLVSATAETSLVLGPAGLCRELPSFPARVITYEEIANLPSAPASTGSQPQFWAAPRLGPEQPAFVTENVSLAETLRLVTALADKLQLSANDDLLIVPAVSPADALIDLLLGFHTGATLDLVAFRNDLPLQQLLDERQTTVAIAEPAQWRAWIANGWRGDRRLTLIARGRHIAHSGWMPGVGSPSVGSEAIPVRSAVTLLSARSGPLATSTEDAEFTPLPGVALSVLGPDGLVAPSGATGELAVSGSEAAGFLAQSTANASFRILGNSNSVVHLHGHRVRLSDLDAALLRAPGVLDATTRMHWREDGTPQLAAWILSHGALDSPGALDIAKLRRSLMTTLPQHLVPATLEIAPAFFFRLDGSVDAARLDAARLIAAPGSVSRNAAASRAEEAPPAGDDLSRELSDIWKDVLHLDTVDPQRPFFDAGGNSLLLVRLFARLNKTFGTRLPITTIFDADTVAKLADRLRSHGEIRPIVPVQTHGHRPPVFMIHSYLLYRSLSQSLGPTQPFYGLRELEADSALDMEERVENYVREIRAVQPHGPYSLIGWCAAGPLTVEVARHLIEAGETVGPVILFDSWLPGYLSSVQEVKTNGSPAPRWHRIRAKLQRHGQKMQPLSTRQRMQYVRNAVVHYALNRRNRFFIRHWRMLNALANGFRVPLPQFMYNTTLTTFAALSAYRPQPVGIHLTLIRAHDSGEFPGASAACGWEQVASHGVEVLWAPGDHETMFLGDKLEVTTELVRRSLQQVDSQVDSDEMRASSSSGARADSHPLRAGSL